MSALARISRGRDRPSLPCLLKNTGFVVFVVLLSSCQLRQEIRFNANGSGTASISVGVDEECLTGPVECSAQAKGLLGGDGPVAQAEAEAAMLPFDVRVEPFESGPPDSPTETGYTLSFDFASLEDLEEKLVSTGRSRTSAFEFSAMTFAANGDGGFTFTSQTRVSAPHGAENAITSFAVVLLGEEGEHNADAPEPVEGGTRFRWTFEGEELSSTDRLQASTCSGNACRNSTMIPEGNGTLVTGVVVGVVVVVAVAFVLMHKRGGERPTPKGR